MEKQELLGLMKQYDQKKAQLEHLKKQFNGLPRYLILDEDEQNYRQICDERDAIVDVIHRHFHLLFENEYLRGYIQSLEYSGYTVTIGTVNTEGKDYEPKDIIEFYQELKDIDQKLKSGRLRHIAHMKTESDYWCCQIWFADHELYQEYCNRYVIASEVESIYTRYIPAELIVLAPFLIEYEKDERLIEIWSGPY